MIIAIDGESAAGKGTISKRLADKLNIKYLDTGSVYRALAFLVYTSATSLNNLDRISSLIKVLDLSNINPETLKQDKIARIASSIAQHAIVREKINEFIQSFIHKNKKQGIILDGRDIGTVVCPDAEFKFYVTASLDVRAERRFKELSGVSGLSLEDIKKSLAERDFNDKNREIGALKQAEDAILIDTSSLTIDEAVNKIFSLIN